MCVRVFCGADDSHVPLVFFLFLYILLVHGRGRHSSPHHLFFSSGEDCINDPLFSMARFWPRRPAAEANNMVIPPWPWAAAPRCGLVFVGRAGT